MRRLEPRVQDPLAIELLKGAYQEGDVVELDWSADQGYVFGKARLMQRVRN